MRKVVATGTFDILHPGHLFYLEESAKHGDELYVIVARDVNVKHKPRPVIPEEQRVCMVRALHPVKKAVLGDITDMFRPIQEINPDVITLGFNQHFEEKRLRDELRVRNLNADVVRIPEYSGCPLSSSRMIVGEILKRRESSGED